jgi:phage repressor protein C with HTH and peptisase S24 domain|nr:MAG TPA: Repressor protein CI [Caudoviricetes sp.]
METGRTISLRERIRINLVTAMENAGINQVQLADKLNISKGTVNNWTRGNNSPDVDMVPRICEVLGISVLSLYSPTEFESPEGETTKKSPSELSEEAQKIAKSYEKLTDHGKGAVKLIMEYEGKAEITATPKQPVGHPKVIPLPKVKRSHGFTEVEVFDEPAAAGLGNPIETPPSHMEQYPSDYVPTKTNFGVLISGDSMEPKIPNGSTVFLQATPVLDNGEIGIFVLDGKSYCKQLKKDEESQEVKLHSLNPEYKDIEIPPFTELKVLGRVLGGYDPHTRDIIW